MMRRPLYLRPLVHLREQPARAVGYGAKFSGECLAPRWAAFSQRANGIANVMLSAAGQRVDLFRRLRHVLRRFRRHDE
jgi:hypothetical protein